MAITADKLIDGVKRRITMPASQVLLQNADILAFADDVLKIQIIPLLESLNQEYFVYSEEIPLVASQSEYSIPYRAIGRTLRELKIVDTSGSVRNLAKVAIEDVQTFATAGWTAGFYFKSDKIALVPEVPSTLSGDVSLQTWYRMPPSDLVETSAAALVSSVNDPVVTVTSVPSDMIAGSEVDFIQGKSGSTIYSIDKVISNISGTQITFPASTVPSELAAGDYISLKMTSPVINFIPNEVYPLVESFTAHRCLESIGDFDGADRLSKHIYGDGKKLGEIDNIKMLLEPRIDGEPTVIVNRYGLVRGNKFWRNGWLYNGL